MKHFALYKIYISLLLLGGGLILPFYYSLPTPLIKCEQAVYAAFNHEYGSEKSIPAPFSFFNDVIVSIIPALKN